MTELHNYLEDYIYGRINAALFSQKCKELYTQVISSLDIMTNLDTIIILPFVHEFAYCNYSDSELTEQALHLYSILSGKKSYQYSSFFKLSPPDSREKNLFRLYCNFQNATLSDLYTIFVQNIDNPKNLKDILNNLIVDILTNLDARHPEECNFNSVNCSYEDLDFARIKDRVILFTSYYLGINPFLLQINILSSNNILYAIV